MQTDETIDRYFYITGWICIAVFAALAAVIGVCGTQILTKVLHVRCTHIQATIVRGAVAREPHLRCCTDI